MPPAQGGRVPSGRIQCQHLPSLCHLPTSQWCNFSKGLPAYIGTPIMGPALDRFVLPLIRLGSSLTCRIYRNKFRTNQLWLEWLVSLDASPWLKILRRRSREGAERPDQS
ncbi:hypothetical protein EYR36_001131 [Pleurotus pulmonarius]|nr:hypothetical protein EYR36_001131 [Pleurotus pulmonarius]